MLDPRFWSIERAAGFVLVLGNAVLLPGLMMFLIRGGQRGGQPPTPAYHVWERSFIMAAVILTAIGFVLLDWQLETAAWIGWATILWNLAWLVLLPLITPRDIYFPVLHHAMPLLIGIALLWRAS